MWEIVRANQRKSAVLVVFMAFLLFGVGLAAGEILIGEGGGILGLLAAFCLWVGLSLLAYFQGRTIFLTLAGAHKIEKKDHPRLYNIVEEMKIASQLPAMPDIYIIDDLAPNAFATGRNPQTAAVAVTTGLLNRLSRDELQGVIAHEMGHVKNRDVLYMTMIGVMMGAVVMISDITMRSLFFGGGRRSRTNSGGGQAQIIILVVGLVLMILAPVIAHVIYMAASRKREYLADASAAIFTRYPEGLAGALEKIAYSPVKMKKVHKTIAPLCIINPIKKLNSVSGLFSTHPSIEDRVKILRSIAGNASYQSYDSAFQKVTGQKKSVIPGSSLKVSAPIGVPVAGKDIAGSLTGHQAAGTVIAGAMLAGALIPEPSGHSEKVRETTDAIWKAKNYRFIQCDCGALLKIPPIYKRPDVPCLRCGTKHSLAS